jgi:hypothetical protein
MFIKLIIITLITMRFGLSFAINTSNPIYLQPSTGLGFGNTVSLNWQDYFENTYIPSSGVNKTRSNQQVVPQLSGSYRTLPVNGNVDWYFSNMAMLNYVGTPDYVYNGDLGNKNINVQYRIKEYMDRYLSFVNSQNTIVNKAISVSGIVTDVLEDSHDSYISTFLMLASNYMATYNDAAWWNANIVKLKSMANTLVSNIDSGKSLTSNFFYQPSLLTGTYMPQFYLEDNIESTSGLLTFSKILQQLNDSTYATYLNASNTIKQGIENNLYNTSQNRYDWAIEKAPTYGYVAVFNSSIYYPNWQAQAFASLYDTNISTTQLNNSFNTFNTGVAGNYWADNTQSGFQSGSNNPYPDGFLSTVAAKRGLTSQASSVIQRVEAQRNAFSYVSIADIAWAAKAKKILNI